MEILKGSFIYGVGIEQTEHVLLFANNHLKTTYKIKFSSCIECNLKRKYENKGLEEDEMVLLTLVQLQDLIILEAIETPAKDIEINFENGHHLKINGTMPKPMEDLIPWNLVQLTPIFKYLIN